MVRVCLFGVVGSRQMASLEVNQTSWVPAAEGTFMEGKR